MWFFDFSSAQVVTSFSVPSLTSELNKVFDTCLFYTGSPNKFSFPPRFSSGFVYNVGSIFILSFFCLHGGSSGPLHKYLYVFLSSTTTQMSSYKWVILVGFRTFLWSLSITHSNVCFLLPCASVSLADTHTYAQTVLCRGLKVLWRSLGG